MTAALRIGTSGSKLALAQAEWIRRRIEAANPGLRAELVVIRTSGDRIVDVPLHQVGGKGLFVKELEAALLDGSIDAAVHSLKDVPGELAPGLQIAAVPEREDVRDVMITRAAGGLAALPPGARVGTSSPRRAALLRALHPQLAVVDLRGNVDTRLAKLERGEVDGIVLAAAGLHRLGVEPPHAVPCDPRQFLPAIGQGALALESAAGPVVEQLRAVEHAPTRQAIDAERAFLTTIGGTCTTPLAGHAEIDGDRLTLRAAIAHPEGRPLVRGERSGAVADGARLGAELARALLAEGGAEVLRSLGWSG
ncbi:MAG TPA: hydroxymethylbilane synthase [Candidatus Dormibacteraeota bacterium]|nr:hydroxymethylbilane synthase [Candidatus Dormibacteraeota bacterium]